MVKLRSSRGDEAPSEVARTVRLKGLAMLGLCAAFLFFAASGRAESTQRVVNGGFEEGFKAWRCTGDVRLQTNSPLEGKTSALIGPGAGSLTQRIETGSGNDFTVSALFQSQGTDDCVLLLRFVDKNGNEVMRVDSLRDMKRSKEDPRKIEHYMKVHPLTKWVEIVLSKMSPGGSVHVDQVGLDMSDENAASLQPACDLAQAMQPFWWGHKVVNEAVLMLSKEDKPATGQLMFHPLRIISVQDYALATNYVGGVDYTVSGRTLTCTPSSRMSRVRDENLVKGELKWNTIGGKQVMVTYEHTDTWEHPPAFVGDRLPHTTRKLEAHAPLTVVAYGDSITHGVGESRLSHIRPYLPPWPELFAHRLKTIYHDESIRLFNSAQSGATSKWGKEYAARMVSSLNPDLVLIAFGQNDFWGISAADFAANVADIIKTVRAKSTQAEFLLVSTMRFDPAYTTNSQYWKVVGEYASQLKSMTGPGVEFVDMTAVTEWVYARKKPGDCLNDPLHPNDYLARWYAQSVAAALDGGWKSVSASTTKVSSKQSLNEPAQPNRDREGATFN